MASISILFRKSNIFPETINGFAVCDNLPFSIFIPSAWREKSPLIEFTPAWVPVSEFTNMPSFICDISSSWVLIPFSKIKLWHDIPIEVLNPLDAWDVVFLFSFLAV